LAARCDPVAIRHAHAGGGAVPGEDNVVREINFSKLGQFAVRHPDDCKIFDFELLFDVGDPAFAEGFPGQHCHRPRTQKRPQCDLYRTGIRRGHDADAIVRRHFKHFARKVDRALELRLAGL
jgi:hypothetical protein